MAFTIKTNISGVSTNERERGPLYQLYENQGVQIERFPENLFSETRKHAIVFFIKEVIKQDPRYSRGVADQVGLTGEALRKGDITGTASNISGAVLDIFNTIGRIDYKTKTTTAIALYVPDSVRFNYDRTYNRADLTSTFGKMYEASQVASSVIDRYKTNGSFDLSKMRDNALNDPNIRRIVAQAAGINPDVATNAAGFALNPQTQVLFQGLDFRTFQFDFLLSPKSAKESEQIQRIVRLLKLHSAPEIENYRSSPGMFFKVPDRFGIQFQIEGAKNDAIPTIGECVLTNIQVDYSPNGWSAFTDGNPVQVRLSLTFQEVEIVDRNKIKNQNY